MFFICFFIVVLTARVALEYYADIPLLSVVIKWLLPTAEWACYIAAGIAGLLYVIKLFKIIFAHSGGVVECGVVAVYTLAAVITVAVLAPRYAVMHKNLLFYIIPAVCAGVAFLLVAIKAFLRPQRRTG